MIQKQVFKAQEHSKNDLLEKEKQQMSEQNLTSSIPYCQSFQTVRDKIEGLH